MRNQIKILLKIVDSFLMKHSSAEIYSNKISAFFKKCIDEDVNFGELSDIIYDFQSNAREFWSKDETKPQHHYFNEEQLYERVSFIIKKLFEEIKKLEDFDLKSPEFQSLKSYPKINTSLSISENLAIRELEVLLDKKIPQIQRNNLYSFGFLIKKDTITGIGFYEQELSNLSSSIANFVNLEFLGLNSNKITTFPDNIGNLQQLKTIFASNNQIFELPPAFRNLINLQILDLSNNKLTCLPEGFEILERLELLNLNYNSLIELPSKIGNLKNLTHLELSLNFIPQIPESFWNLSNLKTLDLLGNKVSFLSEKIENLRKLEELDLSGNQLETLPHQIGSLNFLTKLSCASNNLSSIPDKVRNLSNLTELNLNSNPIEKLPQEIGLLKKMKKILAFSCELSSIPESIGCLENLEILDLNRNFLTELPSSIINLNKLIKIDLRKNNFEYLSSKILTWLQDLKEKGCQVLIENFS